MESQRVQRNNYKEYCCIMYDYIKITKNIGAGTELRVKVLILILIIL
jgi:hypothetical protein